MPFFLRLLVLAVFLLAFPAFFFYPYAQFFEELGEHVAALLFENPSGYFYLVVEGGVFQDVEDGSGTAGFGVHAAYNYLRDAGLDDGAGTHLAGFQCDVHGAVFQAPVAYFFAGFVDGCYFGVGQGVFVGVAAVVAPAYDFVLVDDDAAYRDFSQGVGFFCLDESGMFEDDEKSQGYTECVQVKKRPAVKTAILFPLAAAAVMFLVVTAALFTLV